MQGDRLALQHLVSPGLTAEVRTGECLQTTARVSDTFRVSILSLALFVSHLLHLDIFWLRKVEKKLSQLLASQTMNG